MYKLATCYYAEQWPKKNWCADAKHMKELGIEYVRLGEFAWGQIEPSENNFNFNWLDEVIAILAKQKLKIIFATPTATPPAWVVEKNPQMLALDINGKVRTFGSRRHYCFSNEGYKRQCKKIVSKLAKRYGKNKNIVAWQIDNEYGCHQTTLSFSKSAKAAFQNWLAKKYKLPQALNRAWGNIFWSQQISKFSQIELPNQTTTEANPAHWLDFYRFSNGQVIAFNLLQAKILRKLAGGHLLTHNFMGKVLEVDVHQLSKELDIVAWDSYPLGFLERFGKCEEHKDKFARQGDPDFQAFHHDLYRGCGKKLWVMEQQPGPVNWAAWNPLPAKNMVRLWTWEAFSHGAELVNFFRWRQVAFAQEQMHAGLLNIDSSESAAVAEIKQVASEIKKLPKQKAAQQQSAKILMLFDYPSQWATMIQPHGKNYDGFTLCLNFYQAMRQLGQSLDILSASEINENILNKYKIVLVPHLLFLDKKIINAFAKTSAKIIFGPRTGSRDSNQQIPSQLPPGELQSIFPFKIKKVESLRPTINIKIKQHKGKGKGKGKGKDWLEHLELSGEIKTILASETNQPIFISHKNLYYLATCGDDKLLQEIFVPLLKKSNLAINKLPEGVRLRETGNLRFVFNYGNKSFNASKFIKKNETLLIGKKKLNCGELAIIAC